MRLASAGWVARPHIVALGRTGSGKLSHVCPLSLERSTAPVSPVVVSPHPANSTRGSSVFTTMPREYGNGHFAFTPIGAHVSPRSALQNTSPFVLTSTRGGLVRAIVKSCTSRSVIPDTTRVHVSPPSRLR